MSTDSASRLATVRGADPQSIRTRHHGDHKTEVCMTVFCEWPGFHWARGNVNMILTLRRIRRLCGPEGEAIYSVTPVDSDNLEKGWIVSAVFDEPFLASDIDDIQLFVQRPDGSAAIAYLFAA